jgi:hypothetical protein
MLSSHWHAIKGNKVAVRLHKLEIKRRQILHSRDVHVREAELVDQQDEMVALGFSRQGQPAAESIARRRGIARALKFGEIYGPLQLDALH